MLCPYAHEPFRDEPVPGQPEPFLPTPPEIYRRVPFGTSVCEIGIVADDLTGVLDTAHGFAERGHRTAVVATTAGTDRGSPTPPASVVGYNTDSRYVEASTAARHVSEAVTTLSAERVYKKVDSTLRGNVAVEVDAALRSAGAQFGVFAPAYPAQGRTTRSGVHYVGGVPVDETPYADDVKGPSTAVVADLFSGLDRPVRRLSADHLASDGGRAIVELRAIVDAAGEPPLVVVDATRTEHLETLAGALPSLNALVAGSGGLAKHVPVSGDATVSPTGTATTSIRRDSAPFAVVGSVNPVTIDQLRRVPDEAVFVADSAALVSETVSRRTVTRVVERLRAGEPAVLTAATDDEAVDRTLAEGERRGFADDAVRDRVAATLGATGVAVVEATEPAGLLLSGGDVALATLCAGDATTVSLTGTSIADGMPVGRVEDGLLEGTPIVTKAGGFGGRNALTDYLERFGHP